MGQPDRDEPRRFIITGNRHGRQGRLDSPLVEVVQGPPIQMGERIEVVESREPFPSDEDVEAEELNAAVMAMWQKKAEDAEGEVHQVRAELKGWQERVRRGVATPPPGYDDQYVSSRQFREVCEERDHLETQLRTMTNAYDEAAAELAEDVGLVRALRRDWQRYVSMHGRFEDSEVPESEAAHVLHRSVNDGAVAAGARALALIDDRDLAEAGDHERARAVLDAVSSHRDDEAREVHRDDAACTCVLHEGTDPECYYHGSAEKRAYARAVSDVVEELRRLGRWGFPPLPNAVTRVSRDAVVDHIKKWAADRKAGT
jgi:hypothetical protein